ncbi:MAG: hypothetical protein MIO93_15220 [ANME-2 cluster archaeon]|nr:hypothetical protein [ANME-2 cluster archaeon]
MKKEEIEESGEMIVESADEMELFHKTVNLLETLLINKDAEFHFSTGQIRLQGDISKREEIIKSADLDEEHFEKIIEEILTLIPYIIIEKDTKLSSFVVEDEKPKFKEKCDTINKKLISKQVREKFILELTYKTNLIDKFDWSIITKYHDSSINNIGQLSIAQLRFRIRHPFSEEPDIAKTESFTVECDIYCINEMVEQLKKIEKLLGELENNKLTREGHNVTKLVK